MITKPNENGNSGIDGELFTTGLPENVPKLLKVPLLFIWPEFVIVPAELLVKVPPEFWMVPAFVMTWLFVIVSPALLMIVPSELLLIVPELSMWSPASLISMASFAKIAPGLFMMVP